MVRCTIHQCQFGGASAKPIGVLCNDPAAGDVFQPRCRHGRDRRGRPCHWIAGGLGATPGVAQRYAPG
eukprot:9903139-Lingulodinium_polyedra.AAC.1